MVYLIEKPKKKNHFDIWSISPLNHIRQVDLNMFNLINGFFWLTIKWYFFTSQIEQKIK